jgi:hypothetical protein
MMSLLQIHNLVKQMVKVWAQLMLRLDLDNNAN